MRRSGILLGIATGVVLLVLWMGAGEIASPDRRVLQDYHEGYFEDSAAHGLVVTRLACLDGQVPTLVVRPDREAGPGERGMTLRRQVETGEYGEETSIAVLLHGRNGRKEDLLPVAERFCAAGMICILPDLPSHGESPISTVGFGSRAFERELPGRVLDEVISELHLSTMPHLLWGMSMGGSFAIHAAASEPERWERMVIVSSFDSLEGVVTDSLRAWAGPFAGVLRSVLVPMVKARGGVEISEVNPGLRAGGVSIPVMVVHGDDDELIDFSRGEALYRAFAGEKLFLTVPGGSHDNVLITEAPVYAAMVRWFLGKEVDFSAD